MDILSITCLVSMSNLSLNVPAFLKLEPKTVDRTFPKDIHVKGSDYKSNRRHWNVCEFFDRLSVCKDPFLRSDFCHDSVNTTHRCICALGLSEDLSDVL